MHAPVIWLETGIYAGNVTIKDISRFERSMITDAYLIRIDKGANIDRLVLENVTQRNAEGVTAPFVKNEATIGELIEKAVSYK